MVSNCFLYVEAAEIITFSCREKDDMRHEFQANMPEVPVKTKFYIGGVRDI